MTTSGVGARPDDARPGVLSRHPLVFFFLIAYAGGWLLELPVVLSRTGTGLLLSAYDLTSRAVYGLMCRGRGVS
jgi:hypothetical protein